MTQLYYGHIYEWPRIVLANITGDKPFGYDEVEVTED